MLDRTPYCYRIGWIKQDIWYVGRRTASGCNPSDFWVKYFTSSKKVKEFVQKHGDPDYIKITKTFSSVDECKLWEERFLSKVDARNNLKFLNQVNSDHKLNPLNTGPCSSARKLAISKSRKNTKKLKCEHCNKEIDPGNFKRFHGHFCKHNPDIDSEILKKRSEKNRKSTMLAIQKGTHKHRSPTSFGRVTCPHCKMVGKNMGSMKRFHFQNCSKLTGIQHKKFIPRCSCVICKVEFNLGNFTKHLARCSPTS